jgi:ABC-type Mn2+/Zn2+ transport system permease subunit
VGIVLVTLRAAHGSLLAVGFDRDNAAAFGASPRATDTVLLLLVGAFTVVAVQALGALLVLAMLVGPAATARLVAERLPGMMAVAVAIAAASGAGGLYLSYYADTAAGASIAAVVVVIHFLAVAALQPRPVARLEAAA